MSADGLAQVLQATLSPDAATRRQATAYLEQAGKQPGFAIALLQLAENAGADLTTRQAAATLFKNFVKRNWPEEDGDVPISEGDRTAIKGNLVNLMSSVPPLVQRQLSEALSFISASDFPERWPSLLPELVAKMRTGDSTTVIGVLETAVSIFARFTDSPDTDDNRRVLKVALDGFAGPLTEITAAVDKQITDGLAAGQSLATHRASLGPAFTCLRLSLAVFHALNWIDLPEFFEDNIAAWMGTCHKYLALADPRVKSADDDADEGPLEAVQAGIFDCIGLYAEKYDEEFEPFFATMLGDTWALLSSASATRMSAPHLDPLVIKAVKFLTSSVAKAQHAALFRDASTLSAIVDKVVLPNLLLRDTDEELFDDNPVEFIRRDIEGSDNDTRRRVASDLVRCLVRTQGEPVTALLLGCVNRMLGEYATGNPGTAHVQKDAAICLFTAVAVRASSAAGGVTSLNEAAPVGDFLRGHVLPELTPPPSTPGAPPTGHRPIVKAAALKFVAVFRAQLGREELAALLPAVVPFLGAPSYVVHTYAAAAVERMLCVKDAPGAAAAAAPGSGGPPTLRLPLDALSAQLVPLFTGLFGRMTAAGYPENDYLMRCLMRVAVVGRDRVAPFAGQVLGGLTTLLGRVCANPSHPTYNHYLFEAIAALMKSVCGSKPQAVADFEGLLFPPFQSVLVNDVAEFLPYVFQLLAELLELRPSPPPGESALTDGYKSLLPPILTASLWTRKGNVPALTQLACAYLRKGGVYVASSGQLLPLLGVFQKLLSTKNQEEFAFDIGRAIVEGCAWPSVAPHFPVLLQLLLVKLQDSKAARIAKQFVHWACVLVGLHGPGPLEAGLNGLSPGLFASIAENVLVPMANRVTGAPARRETVVGLARLLTEAPTGPALLTDPARGSGVWGKLLTAAVEVAEPQPHEGGRTAGAAPAGAAAGSTPGGGGVGSSSLGAGSDPSGAAGGAGELFVSEEAELEAALSEVAGESASSSEYSAAYSKLVFAQMRDRYAFATSAPDVKRYLAAALAVLGSSMPGRVPQAVAATPVAAMLAAYCAAAGVTVQ